MYGTQAPYRDLWYSLLGGDERPVYERLLAPWAEANPYVMEWPREFADRTGDPIPKADNEELCRLFALGRVNETLLLRFQPDAGSIDPWAGPRLTAEEYIAFMSGFGAAVASRDGFDPFFHEIVRVEPSPDDADPIRVVRTFWPCLMLGPMILSRAGVSVSGGRKHVLKSVAESSTLYWAHVRRNRPRADLSDGWGSNSNWATAFRRDYLLGGTQFFNADEAVNAADPPARLSCGEPEDDLSPAERIELVTHRCFVRTEKPHADLWPYDLTYRSRGN